MPRPSPFYKSQDKYLEEILDLESKIRRFEFDMKCQEDVEGLKKESTLLQEGLKALKERIKEKEARLSEYLDATDALYFRMQNLDSELARKEEIVADIKAPSRKRTKPEEEPKTAKEDSTSWWGAMPWVGSILKEKGESLEESTGGLEVSAIREIREKLRSFEEEAKGIKGEETLDLTKIRRDIEKEYLRHQFGEGNMKEKEDELLVLLKEIEKLERVPLQTIIDNWWSELRSLEEELEKGKLTQTELEQNLTSISRKVEVCAYTLQKLKVS